MASMFIKHRVADFDRWKPVFDDHETVRKQAGTSAHSLHRDADDPNVVVIAFRVDDIARAREFASSDQLRAAMERAGVESPPEIWFTDDVEDKTYYPHPLSLTPQIALTLSLSKGRPGLRDASGRALRPPPSATNQEDGTPRPRPLSLFPLSPQRARLQSSANRPALVYR